MLHGAPKRMELAETVSIQSRVFITTESQRGTEGFLNSRASTEQLCGSLCLRGLKRSFRGFDGQELGLLVLCFMVLLNEWN
jgi:hypothetical protein